MGPSVGFCKRSPKAVVPDTGSVVVSQQGDSMRACAICRHVIGSPVTECFGPYVHAFNLMLLTCLCW